MADDEMKRWLEEAKKVQVRPGFSHGRTKPVIVETLKTRAHRQPDPHHIINGFLVVRLPSDNEVVPSERVLPSVNGIFYAGIDRCAWDDLYDEDYHTGKTPPEVASIAKGMQDDCVDVSGIALARDFDVTRGLLDYANRTAARNEIIAIRSEQLDEAKGSFDTGIPIEWLGFDVVGEGEWSLVAGGLFAAPEHFQPWTRRINKSGLFDTPRAASDYERAYQTAVTSGHAEELAAPSAGLRILQIQVGRVGPW